MIEPLFTFLSNQVNLKVTIVLTTSHIYAEYQDLLTTARGLHYPYVFSIYVYEYIYCLNVYLFSVLVLSVLLSITRVDRSIMRRDEYKQRFQERGTSNIVLFAYRCIQKQCCWSTYYYAVLIKAGLAIFVMYESHLFSESNAVSIIRNQFVVIRILTWGQYFKSVFLGKQIKHTYSNTRSPMDVVKQDDVTVTVAVLQKKFFASTTVRKLQRTCMYRLQLQKHKQDKIIITPFRIVCIG